MTQYLVRWEIHCEAVSPAHAVDIAREYMPATQNSATRQGTLFAVVEKDAPQAKWLVVDSHELDARKN